MHLFVGIIIIQKASFISHSVRHSRRVQNEWLLAQYSDGSHLCTAGEPSESVLSVSNLHYDLCIREINLVFKREELYYFGRRS